MLKKKAVNGHGDDDILDLILNIREGKELKRETDSNTGVLKYDKVSLKVIMEKY